MNFSHKNNEISSSIYMNKYKVNFSLSLHKRMLSSPTIIANPGKYLYKHELYEKNTNDRVENYLSFLF